VQTSPQKGALVVPRAASLLSPGSREVARVGDAQARSDVKGKEDAQSKAAKRPPADTMPILSPGSDARLASMCLLARLSHRTSALLQRYL